MRVCHYVITSINAPSQAVRAIDEHVGENDNSTFSLIGDKKTPSITLENGSYFEYEQQASMGLNLARVLPPNTYSRKMLGYLEGLRMGADLIRETDDDNEPFPGFFLESWVTGELIEKSDSPRFVNPYPYFGFDGGWPRGFPLDEIGKIQESHSAAPRRGDNEPLIVQALADGDPDVDAIMRLTQPSRFTGGGIRFRRDKILELDSPGGQLAPFNSQLTQWDSRVASLMYLPVTCSFRMTDIWRGYIAQRALGTLGEKLVFVGPLAFQLRNPHALMDDLEQEVEGYLGVRRFLSLLDSINVDGEGLGDYLRKSYRLLTSEGFFHEEEFSFLEAWLTDISALD